MEELNVSTLMKMSVSKLQKLAKEMGINGVSGLRKEELILSLIHI